ncbi:MAG: fumarylacetoacetate hydrolase family protein [Pontibacterium sp.]
MKTITHLILFCAFWSTNGVADNRILPLETGLTLAEVVNGVHRHTIAVFSDTGETIKGYNLSEHFQQPLAPIELYSQQGYESLRRAIRQADKNSLQDYAYNELLSPAGDAQHHFAAGLNYADHADEVDAEAQPFIFLKTTKATRNQPISYHAERLLDYEVEICARPLSEISNANVSEHDFGYFLCGDFTDRASLLRNIDLDYMQTGKGFSQSKSPDTYFPTGPYLFIPKPDTQLLNTLMLELSVNDQQKQLSSASALIWSMPRIVEEIFQAHQERRDTHSDITQQWLKNNTLNSQSSILTGTPDGVIMAPPSLSYKITRGISYVLTGAIFSDQYRSVREYVVSRYIKDLLDSNTFLKPGDSVSLSATGLGSLVIDITSP